MELVGLQNEGLMIILNKEEKTALHHAIGGIFLENGMRPFRIKNSVCLEARQKKILTTVADAVEAACSGMPKAGGVMEGEIVVMDTGGV